MKNVIVIIFGVFMFTISSFVFIGCDNNETDQEEPENIENTDQDAANDSVNVEAVDQDMEGAMHYQCPMNCEEDKTYEQAGQCPVCGMNLVAINETEIE